MISRSNVILAGLLVGQVLLLAASLVSSRGTQSRAIEPIVAGLSAPEIERMTIVSSPEDSVIFARKDAGWVLPAADDFPVDGDKVDEALGKLLGLDTRRLVASNPVNFARLEVKDDDYRRRIELSGGDASAILYLGGGDTVYVRRADENQVYLGGGLTAWELSTQIATWVDASYINIAQADVQEIRVQNAQGEFTLLRDGESWTYAGLRADEVLEDTKIPSILRNAASIRLVEPLGLAVLDDYGMADPSVIVEVKYQQLVETQPAEGADADNEASIAEPQFTDAMLSLAFGAALESGDVVLKSSGSDYFVAVRETAYQVFAELSREDLVKAPASDAGGE
ncbi:MAG: DUF4340 domain-containing protein [Chloroflexi bacterium]|nr:DUF4340 domain-containing protein [Chloroflexota bacterium]MCY3581683.1 DUF4340 domain-containing protein [Chloroflexota bacterium]MCY3715002.1 DUF4340 domain-containing protein [Chloroflexota bacterium]MDE2651826.1 DUF4340 domain-containing protein [Chloroflexota bacterium]MXV93782.1 DUF4340 domain-containing protein [Chloroflexota bacterium]